MQLIIIISCCFNHQLMSNFIILIANFFKLVQQFIILAH